MSLDDLKFKIREEIPISSVIGNYLSIKKSGSSLVSLCPFHNDSSPSMHINDSKKLFKCFACQAAGDAITFVMKFKNMQYVDALKEICSRQGINFDQFQDEKKSNPKFEMAKKILSKTALLYRKIATSHKFSEYDLFIKNRGLSEEIASNYSLGFAPNKNSLCDYLKTIPDEKEKSFAFSVSEEIGLIKKDKNDPNAHYDTFRERIIFPIWDQNGHVIGFTSRSVHEKQMPKYMNSKDSFIFNKGNILYGLHLAKTAIREKDAVILVEGNMDQVALYNHGFQNAVAVMGVALGNSSLDRILAMTKNIFLSLDSDSAGFKAMERINKQFAERGIVAKYLEFSPHKDPDDYLKNEGVVKFQEKLEKAIPAFDILLEQLIPEKMPEVLDRKLEILNKAFEILSPLKSELSATERIVSFAKRLGLKSEASQIVNNYQDYLAKNGPKVIKEALKTQENSKKIQNNSNSTENIEHSSQNNSESLLEEKIQIKISKGDQLLLQELLQLPSILTSDKVTDLLALVSSDEVKKYIEKIRKVILEIDESEYVSVVSNLTLDPTYSDELRQRVASALYKYKFKELDNKTKTRFVHDLKIKLQTEDLKIRKDEIKNLQKICEAEDEMTKLLKELSDIEKKIQDLKKLKPELK